MSQSPILTSFITLEGGFSQAIAPGPRLVTLNSSGAAWWENEIPVVIPLPGIPVDGTRWSVDAKLLQVGLGHIDIESKTWLAEPELTHWNIPGPYGDSPLKAAAWYEDGSHVALLCESRRNKRQAEIVIVSTADGHPRGRRVIESASSSIICSGNHLLVAGDRVTILDLDAHIISNPINMPPHVFRVREGAGMFAAIGAAGPVDLIDPVQGEKVATWDLRAVDAVPFSGGAVGVDLDGRVYVGCIEGESIHTVAEIESGVAAPVVRVIDDKVIVAGNHVKPVRMAMLNAGCC